METLSIIQSFHGKGVCAVHFSSSGRYLLTVGLDDEHSVAVWRWAEGIRSLIMFLTFKSSTIITARVFVNISITSSPKHLKRENELIMLRITRVFNREYKLTQTRQDRRCFLPVRQG